MNKNVDKNNDVEMVFGDKVIIVGVDPNLNPSMRKDPIGRSKKVTAITGSMGDVEMEGAAPTHEECDNASDRPTGMLNLVGMNGVRIEAGAGGIEMTSAGNITLMPGGGLCNIAATESLSCLSRNVNIASTGATSIGGGSLSVESSASSFSNNVAMQGNTKMSGGCFVNGEAYIPHMTTQKQENQTEACDEAAGFVNPDQVFVLLPGDKTLLDVASNARPQRVYLDVTFNENSFMAVLLKLIADHQIIDIIPGHSPWTDIAETKGNPLFSTPPPPIPPIVDLPSIYTKPILTRILSKGIMATLAPVIPSLSSTMISLHPSLADAFNPLGGTADFTLPGHRHKFYGPACSYTDSTNDLYEEAKSVEGNDLVKHKPCERNGGKKESDRILEEDKKMLTKYLENFGKRIGRGLGLPL